MFTSVGVAFAADSGGGAVTVDASELSVSGGRVTFGSFTVTPFACGNPTTTNTEDDAGMYKTLENVRAAAEDCLRESVENNCQYATASYIGLGNAFCASSSNDNSIEIRGGVMDFTGSTAVAGSLPTQGQVLQCVQTAMQSTTCREAFQPWRIASIRGSDSIDFAYISPTPSPTLPPNPQQDSESNGATEDSEIVTPSDSGGATLNTPTTGTTSTTKGVQASSSSDKEAFPWIPIAGTSTGAIVLLLAFLFVQRKNSRSRDMDMSILKQIGTVTSHEDDFNHNNDDDFHNIHEGVNNSGEEESNEDVDLEVGQTKEASKINDCVQISAINVPQPIECSNVGPEDTTLPSAGPVVVLQPMKAALGMHELAPTPTTEIMDFQEQETDSSAEGEEAVMPKRFKDEIDDDGYVSSSSDSSFDDEGAESLIRTPVFQNYLDNSISSPEIAQSNSGFRSTALLPVVPAGYLGMRSDTVSIASIDTDGLIISDTTESQQQQQQQQLTQLVDDNLVSDPHRVDDDSYADMCHYVTTDFEPDAEWDPDDNSVSSVDLAQMELLGGGECSFVATTNTNNKAVPLSFLDMLSVQDNVSANDSSNTNGIPCTNSQSQTVMEWLRAVPPSSAGFMLKSRSFSSFVPSERFSALADDEEPKGNQRQGQGDGKQQQHQDQLCGEKKLSSSKRTQSVRRFSSPRRVYVRHDNA